MDKKKRIWIIAAAAVMVLAVCAGLVLLRGARGEEIDETLNLLYNPSFETLDENGMPDGWIEGKWYWDSGVSVLSVSDEASEGNHSVEVYNAGENDARFTQTVSVVPDAWYRITCRVKAEGCEPGRNGAGVSVEDTFISSEYVYDTDGEWVDLTLYGKTGPDQTYITVMARIGGYGSLNVGRAWFDDFELVRLKELPEGATYVSFATNPPRDAAEEEDGEKDHTDLIGAVAWLSLALMAVCAQLMRMKKDKRSAMIVLTAACVVGLIARIVCAVSIRGYKVDMDCFMGWASRMVQYGPTGFYDAGWCDYPPGYMLVLWLLGGLRNIFGLTADGPGAWLLFKSVPILCDFLTGLALWKMSEKRLGAWGAALLAAFYLLCPATVINSAAWGQVDSVLTLFFLLAMYAAVRGRWVRALAVYAVAVLMKPQALMFGPLGLMAAVCEAVRGDNRGATLREIGKGILAALAIIMGVIAPFSLGQGMNPVSWAVNIYSETLSSYPYITVNACNLYALLGKNWVALENAGWLQYFSWGMYLLSFGYAIFLYVRSGRRGTLFLSAAVMLTLVFAFGAKMHERYLYPALAMLVVSYAISKDMRLLIALGLAAAGQFLNCALVLQNEHLNAAQQAINFLTAALNIVSALVTAWAGWDICVRGATIALPKMSRANAAAGGVKRYAPVRPIMREDAGMRLKRKDYLIMAVVTAVYSVVAFVNLGATEAPETAWTSTLAGESVVFDLGETNEFNMTYYGGICNSSFTVSFSEDGEVWTEEKLAIYDQGEIFRWLWYTPVERGDNGKFTRLESGYPVQTARYIRITAEKAGLVLHEIAFLDENGEALPIANVTGYGGDGERAMNPMLLSDEQHTVPAYPSYYNSTYFDEIYHARTAYEHLHGLRPYETTHPPLGKVMIMWGIQLFGMTPFGWRFSGTLLGCLMLPLMYMLAKQLFKKTEYASFAMILMALDCMHFTQTRISTIDTYGVFFILLMYLFMFRYCQMNFYFDDFKKTLVPLGLCGISMGLGIASKWICIYAAIGLAVLFFYTMARRYMEYRAAKESGGGSPAEEKARQKFWKYFWITGAFCVVFFIVIPLLIYYFSYYWYMKPMGGLSVESVWKAQESMFNYHSGLTNDDHYFKSPWYEWPLIVKPIWYYSGTEFMESGIVSSISCMGNPAVWWCGAAAMLFVLIRLVRMRGERNYLYVAIGFAAQYVPWMLVPRSMFIYHYFASVPFIILAIVMVDRWLEQRNFRWRKALAIGLIAAAFVLFVAFYPLMSGTPVARSFANYLRWFNWYNF